MTEVKIDIIILKLTCGGWRGVLYVSGCSHDFYVEKNTATEVIDALMVELKDTVGVVLDTK